MKVGSLFSGVGGFDLGFEQCGMEVAWQVENDKRCQQVLRYHWPNVPLYEDVRNVSSVQLAERGERGVRDDGGSDGTTRHLSDEGDIREGETTDGREPVLDGVDIICGGFPCQDLSVAGGRKGLYGERSGLWYEFDRIISEIAPEWVVIENVPGLLSSHKGRDMAIVLDSLAHRGYGWAYRVLDSQYFGVAQRRRRVFIVGCRGDRGRAFKALFPVGTSMSWDTPPSRRPQAETAGRLEGGTRVGDWPADVAPTVNAHYGTKWGLEDQHVLQGAGLFVPEVSNTLAHGDGSRGYRLDMDGMGAFPVHAFHENQRAELNVSEVAYQVSTGGGKPGQGYPAIIGMVPRRLTPKECERLQGFPDDWTRYGRGKTGDLVELKDTPRYTQMGNAVTVNVIQWIGERIR